MRWMVLALLLGCGDKGGSSSGEEEGWEDGVNGGQCPFSDCEADFPVIWDPAEIPECWEDHDCLPGVRVQPPDECLDTEPVCFTHCSPLAWYDECEWDDRCEAACEHIYSPDDCDIQSPGESRFNHCISASLQPGEAGDYSPLELPSSSGSVSLDNRAQVVLWLECMEVKSCEELEDGYCAPVW